MGEKGLQAAPTAGGTSTAPSTTTDAAASSAPSPAADVVRATAALTISTASLIDDQTARASAVGEPEPDLKSVERAEQDTETEGDGATAQAAAAGSEPSGPLAASEAEPSVTIGGASWPGQTVDEHLVDPHDFGAERNRGGIPRPSGTHRSSVWYRETVYDEEGYTRHDRVRFVNPATGDAHTTVGPEYLPADDWVFPDKQAYERWAKEEAEAAKEAEHYGFGEVEV